MAKEKILDVKFDFTPVVKLRVISEFDTEALIKNKKKYPFELMGDIIVTVFTTARKFSFRIKAGYCWNGADIPRSLFLIGQSKENHYLIASMVHDYLLEYKSFIYNEVLKQGIKISEYRRLTSLIFREILKKHKTNTVKANIMSGAVEFFQKTLNRGSWRIGQE